MLTAKLNGILLVALGAIAMIAPLFSSVWGVPIVGVAIFLSGIVELADAWYSDSSRTHYSSGIFSVAAGALISFQSAFAFSGLMVATSIVLLLDGGTNVVRAIRGRSDGSRLWDFFNGAANMLLALIVWWLRDTIGAQGFGFFLGLRMAASGWQTLTVRSAEDGDVFARPEDEHPNRALGLPPHPIIGFIHREAVAHARSRTPADFYWSVVFVVVFFAIHVGRLDAEWTFVGMVTPAAATLGDIVAALVLSIVVLFPLEVLWHRISRPIERAAWDRMLNDRAPESEQRWSERAVRWWAEQRLRRSVARDLENNTLHGALRQLIRAGLPLTAVLIAVHPIWGFSWYFNSENWATAAWQKIAETRVDEWREAMQTRHLPKVAQLDRARKFSDALLNQRRTGGFSQLFIAPSYSPDGKYIAFISQGSFLRGEVFPDLWLGDGETGKRIKRLIKSTLDPDFEELRLIYSQSAFSPDGKSLAFTAQRNGRDVLYLMDVQRRKVTHTFDKFALDVVMNPSFSPDGKQVVISGYNSGVFDLFIVNVADGSLRQLTNDKHAEMMPQWSPDGRTIAFATDRGEGTDLDVLKFAKWKIGTLDLASNAITILPNQDGLNLNPMWAPDGKSLAFLSDRNGTSNIFLYEFDKKEHYQLTNVVGAISSIAEYSPAITWARGADKLAFTYYENGDYTIWTINNPRKLKKDPYRAVPATVVAAATPTPATPTPTSNAAQAAEDMRRAIENAARAADTTRREETVSIYRSATGLRPSGDIPGSNERSGNAPSAGTVPRSR